jgi:hypothetical protein
VKNRLKKWHHRIQTGNPCGPLAAPEAEADSAQCQVVPKGQRSLRATKFGESVIR